MDSGFDYAASFSSLSCIAFDLVRSPAIERRVRSIGIVVSDPASDAGSRLAAGLEGGQEHTFIFE